MKITSASYAGCAIDLEACPVSNLPEFAFVGRSNVGKSSLVNMLAEVKGLAKISGTPGKTKLINFFLINDRWTLVDLPGYGFARVSKAQQAAFNERVSAYLAFVDWLQQCKIPYSIILTKTDCSAETKVISHEVQLMRALDDYGLKPNEVFKCSAKTKRGRGAILNWIEGQLPKKPKKKQGKAIQLGWMKK